MKNQKNKELSEYLKSLMEFNNDHNYFSCKDGLKELVAANPKTPSDILDLLIEDEYSDTYIKTRVANNPNTSLETLFKLSKNRSWDVKHKVFDHFKWKGPECEEIRRVQRGW